MKQVANKQNKKEPKPIGLTERFILVLISIIAIGLGVWYLLK